MFREPCRIGNVAFTNRVLRSSMGGRNCFYDGTVSPAFIHFDRRFAEIGVAGIISATIGVNKQRMSPLPSLYDERFVAPLKDAVRQITAGTDCRYIVQLGDTGAHTHTSLKPQDEDRISASPFFDLLYGYHNRSREMTGDEITTTIASFATAAQRVAAADCDGVEITASKGYLIHLAHELGGYFDPTTSTLAFRSRASVAWPIWLFHRPGEPRPADHHTGA